MIIYALDTPTILPAIPRTQKFHRTFHNVRKVFCICIGNTITSKLIRYTYICTYVYVSAWCTYTSYAQYYLVAFQLMQMQMADSKRKGRAVTKKKEHTTKTKSNKKC